MVVVTKVVENDVAKIFEMLIRGSAGNEKI